jgi:hypothetical protein
VVNYPLALRGGSNLPVRGPRITLVDTAAALGLYGRLTAFCAESKEFLQVDPQGRRIEPDALP